MKKILEISDLEKTFYSIHGEIEAIKNISLDVYENEFICIVGTSGCGKSTLLNIISYLDTQTSGTFKYSVDNPIIGYSFQNDALLPWLNILDNALIGLKIKNLLTMDNINYVKGLLKTYGLEEFLDKYPKELSGGMRQRVALIRTLAIKPDILMLDEPFSALDYQSRLIVSNDIYKIIKNEKKTVIMITHDIGEAISMADRVVVLSKRPAVIKKEFKIDFDKSKSPVERRSDSLYLEYYNKIWKELDNTLY